VIQHQNPTDIEYIVAMNFDRVVDSWSH